MDPQLELEAEQMQMEATHTLRQLQETDSLKSGPKGRSKTEGRADIKKSPLENQLHSRHKAAMNTKAGVHGGYPQPRPKPAHTDPHTTTAVKTLPTQVLSEGKANLFPCTKTTY